MNLFFLNIIFLTIKVWRAREKSSGKEVAIKLCIDPQGEINCKEPYLHALLACKKSSSIGCCCFPSFCSFLDNESRKAQGDGENGILPLRAYFATMYCTAMVMDLMDEDLRAFSDRFSNGVLTFPRVLQLSLQLSRAVSHLASLKIMHRDIHMRNILVKVPKKSEKLKVALTDFGWGTATASSNLNRPTKLTGGAYITSYRPPEIFFTKGSCFSTKGEWKGPSNVSYSFQPRRGVFLVTRSNRLDRTEFERILRFKISKNSGFPLMFGL